MKFGTQDFTSFANQADTGCAARGSTRTLQRLDIFSEPGGVRLEFEGNGFLYKMVRLMVGALVKYALGKMQIEDITARLSSGQSRAARFAAPAEGLFLIRVRY